MDVAVESVERDSDGPWDLPEGWVWTALGQIVDIHDHRRRPIKSEDRQKRIANRQPNELFPYYGATGKVGFIDGYLFDFPSILLGEDGAPFLDRQRNKAYFVEGKYWVNNHAHIITPQASTISGWLLHSLNFIDYGPHVGGSTRLKLTKADLERIPIPLAPLAEQKRIVARIDALFAEIAEGEAALEAARKGLDTFRRALPKAAVTGELTKDWREKNPVTETGHDLLARIKAERAAQGRAKGQAKGRGKRAADTPPLDTSALPDLPEGWAWGTVDHVKASDQRNGISIAGSPSPPGVKAMRLDALTAHGINLDAVRYIPLPEDRVTDYRVNAGDLLISRANGSAEFVGRAVYVSDIAETVVFPDTIIRYPLWRDEQIGRWMEMAWNSPLGRSQIRGLAKTTAGILKISQEDISQISLPIPPPAEAAEILRRVSEALAASADTLTMLDAEAADAARLKQSILKSAFEGRLAPQDPAEEPASVLLARLKATPSTAAPARRGRKKRDP
jgi:type I restriction enzyme S subunit